MIIELPVVRTPRQSACLQSTSPSGLPNKLPVRLVLTRCHSERGEGSYVVASQVRFFGRGVYPELVEAVSEVVVCWT